MVPLLARSCGVAEDVLENHLTETLLDVTAFTNAGKHFQKKLNTVNKVLLRDGFSPTEKIVTETAKQSEINTIEIDAKKRALQSEIFHWEKLAKIEEKKGRNAQAKQYNEFLNKARRALDRFYHVNGKPNNEKTCQEKLLQKGER